VAKFLAETGTLGHMTADLPRERRATFDVLLQGTLTEPDGGVASSCTLIREGDRAIVVDPGMASGPEAILGPLRALGLEPEDVTDVILGHHHPDHTLNAALFPRAAVHDHWATYRGTDWEDVDAEGRELSPSVRLIRTPGHTLEDISTVIGTAEGIVVLTHTWFKATGPAEDPTAEDADALHASRARILGIADVIVPGHGAAFRPSADIPR
jgi:glyoxylase-like metal-dependent hydrolase (beta-lactamase superfamily II)